MFDGGLGGGPNLEDVLSSAREEFNGRKRSFSNANSAGDLAMPFQQQQSRSLVPDSPWNSTQQPFQPNQSIRPSPQQASSLIGNEDHNFARPNYSIHDAFPPPNNSQNIETGRTSDGYSNLNNSMTDDPVISNDLQHQVVDERALDRYVSTCCDFRVT